FSDLNFSVKRLFKRFLQLSFCHPKPANRSPRLRAPHDMARIIGRFETGASGYFRKLMFLRSFAG
uniref:hypothetical protein n=1 Tax=Rheinheimera sp. TaxID=1869214 RepID=UPI0040476435